MCNKGSAVLTFVGNGFVLYYRSVIFKGSSRQNAIIFSLAVSDMLMSFYLMGIGVADITYLGLYALKDIGWRTSLMCKLLAFLANLSTEVSLATILLLSSFVCCETIHHSKRWQTHQNYSSSFIDLGNMHYTIGYSNSTRESHKIWHLSVSQSWLHKVQRMVL